MTLRGGEAPTWPLRPLTATDVPAMAQLLTAVMRDPWTQAMLTESVEAGAFGLLVPSEATGTRHALSGFALLRLVGEEAEVLQLAVAPDCRRQGLGRFLLMRGVGEIARRGITALFLEVREGNLAARELYAHAGFIDVGHRPRYYRDGEDARVLRLSLAFPLPG